MIDFFYLDEQTKEEEQARLEKEKEEERKREQDKLEEDMKKRREKVEQWRRERGLTETIELKHEQEESLKKEKGWSLEDDAEEDEDDKQGRGESSDKGDAMEVDTQEKEAKQPQATIEHKPDVKPVAEKLAQPEEEEEEEDPLEAYMKGVQTQMRKDWGQVETFSNGHVTHVQVRPSTLSFFLSSPPRTLLLSCCELITSLIEYQSNIKRSSGQF